jgi:uncharacterized membrane protein YuzA (DUF378 family)
MPVINVASSLLLIVTNLNIEYVSKKKFSLVAALTKGTTEATLNISTVDANKVIINKINN